MTDLRDIIAGLDQAERTRILIEETRATIQESNRVIQQTRDMIERTRWMNASLARLVRALEETGNDPDDGSPRA